MTAQIKSSLNPVLYAHKLWKIIFSVRCLKNKNYEHLVHNAYQIFGPKLICKAKWIWFECFNSTKIYWNAIIFTQQQQGVCCCLLFCESWFVLVKHHMSRITLTPRHVANCLAILLIRNANLRELLRNLERKFARHKNNRTDILYSQHYLIINFCSICMTNELILEFPQFLPSERW